MFDTNQEKKWMDGKYRTRVGNFALNSALSGEIDGQMNWNRIKIRKKTDFFRLFSTPLKNKQQKNNKKTIKNQREIRFPKE